VIFMGQSYDPLLTIAVSDGCDPLLLVASCPRGQGGDTLGTGGDRVATYGEEWHPPGGGSRKIARNAKNAKE